MIKWFSGKPAHEGWWLTRVDSAKVEMWRWWNGKHWSIGVLTGATPATVEDLVTISAITQDFEWSTYYPEYPTVPRLDPTGLTQGEIDWFYDMAPTMQAAANLGLRIQCGGPGEDWRDWESETLCHPRYDWRYFVAAHTTQERQSRTMIPEQYEAICARLQKLFFNSLKD